MVCGSVCNFGVCLIADTRGPLVGKSTGAGTSIERPEGRGLIPEDTLE